MGRHSHHHANAELLLCLHGRSLFGLDGRVHSCVKGSLVVIRPFEPHDKGYPRHADGLEHLWVAMLEDRAMAWRVRVQRGQMLEIPGARWLIDVSDVAGPLSVLRGTGPGAPAEVLRLQLITAAALIVTRVVQAQARPPAGPADPSFAVRNRLDLIRRHIEQTAGKGVSLENIARLAGYSRFHFLRLFRHHYGQTVHQYVDVCRARKVRELLANDVPKKVVAMELGFSCPAAFSRWYASHR